MKISVLVEFKVDVEVSASEDNIIDGIVCLDERMRNHIIDEARELVSSGEIDGTLSTTAMGF